MKNTSEYTLYHTPSLIFTPRKRRYTANLLYVEDGLVLVRLGKTDIPVYTGQGFWLPFECLHALTITPDTRLHQLAVSPRTQHPLPERVGHVVLPPLLTAGLIELGTPTAPVLTAQQSHHIQAVLLDQIMHLAPTQQLDTPTQALADCAACAQTGQPPVSAAQHYQLQALTQLTIAQLQEYFTVRQLRAAIKSGKTPQRAAESAGLSTADADTLYTRYACVFER
ncbi:hypothetical protein BZG25_12415 [Salinivibrio sp. ML198]|uniref:hypothetical protein n=1 Tax=Salinivibrio sp. ML198 TaxID=1909458 RepID=UPI0009897730|nr:hypothetical protein [Salinivibrio sp. ML198]OOE78462.1 hypothetical protein BZG25_12415 [Salinivibrio sp. ML198]